MPNERLKIAVSLSCVVVLICLIGKKSVERLWNFPDLPVSIQPDQIAADGQEVATISIRSNRPERPVISFRGHDRGAVIGRIERNQEYWKATIHAGILPGRLSLRIESPGYKAASAELTAVLDANDSNGDGTPDFLRLDNDRDRENFRSWFVWLAEAEYFQPPGARPAEIDDCAALIRYAYREALHAHDSRWANSSGLPEFPSFDSVDKYHYPFTPLSAALFRSGPGRFRPADLSDGVFLQFADAQTLWRFNTHLVSRSLAGALPGDLLFFRQQATSATFHGMIYAGDSKVRPDGRRYLIYHTGPTHSGARTDPGEIRRPAVDELMRFPQPEWRPVASNPAFLGVFRWNILRRSANETNAFLR